MLTNRLRTMGRVILLSILAAMATPTAFAQEVKLPQTEVEHETRAKSYREEAAKYRASAVEHKQMSTEYAKQHPATKAQPHTPWNDKMAKHCDMLVKDYEKLATDAEKAADYHEMRAKELRGG